MPASGFRKQVPPQGTVGAIGSEWQESAPSKETTRPAQTNPQSTKNQREGHPLDSNQLTTCEGRPTYHEGSTPCGGVLRKIGQNDQW